MEATRRAPPAAQGGLARLGAAPASAEGSVRTRGASESEGSEKGTVDFASDAASSSGGEVDAALTTADMDTLGADRLRELLAQREEELRVAAELGQMMLDRANAAEEALDEECERSHALSTELEAVKERHELVLHRRAKAQEELLEKELQCKRAEEEAARWRGAAAEAQEEATSLRRSLFRERDRSRKLAGEATSASMRLRAAERLEGELASKQSGSCPPQPVAPRTEGQTAPGPDGEGSPKRRPGRRMSSLVRFVRGRRQGVGADAGPASPAAAQRDGPLGSEASERAAMAAEECLLWRVAAREASRMLSLVEAANATLEAQAEEREVILDGLQTSLSEREAEAAREAEVRELALTDWQPEGSEAHRASVPATAEKHGGRATLQQSEGEGEGEGEEPQPSEAEQMRRQSSRAQLFRVREAVRAGRRSSAALGSPHGTFRERSVSAAAPQSPAQAAVTAAAGRGRDPPLRRRRDRLSRAETEFRVQLQEHRRRRSGVPPAGASSVAARRRSRVISAGPPLRHRTPTEVSYRVPPRASRAGRALPPSVASLGDAAALDTAGRGAGERAQLSQVDGTHWRSALEALAGTEAASALGARAEPRTRPFGARGVGPAVEALLAAASTAARRAGEGSGKLLRAPTAPPNPSRTRAAEAAASPGAVVDAFPGGGAVSTVGEGSPRTMPAGGPGVGPAPVTAGVSCSDAPLSGHGGEKTVEKGEKEEEEWGGEEGAEPEARGWEDRLPRLQRFLVEAQHSLERRRHNILVTAACLCSGQPPLCAPWLPDRAALACCHCSTPFAPYIRRHHCRACGGLFCYACSDKRVDFSRIGAPTGGATRGGRVRVCDECFAVLSLAQRERGTMFIGERAGQERTCAGHAHAHSPASHA